MLILLSLLVEIQRLPTGGYDYFYQFGRGNWQKEWIVTKAENYTGQWGTIRAASPTGLDDETLLFMKDGPKYFGISHPFETPINITNNTFVFQYEIRRQDSHDCSGGYAKLFSSENYHQNNVTNETKYSIMFGPDKCSTTNKVHFIYRFQMPHEDTIKEHHMTSPPESKGDKLNHLYTLIIRPDNTFSVFIDDSEAKKGNLLNDFDPPITPPKEIPDPTDKKPSDWPEKKIPDPNETKPEDWNETEPEYIEDVNDTMPADWKVNESMYIPDPNATKPQDWDEIIMGDWEPPIVLNPNCSNHHCGNWTRKLVKNEKYKGKWHAKLIDNPNYKGEWEPRKIPNPNYTTEPINFTLMPIVSIGYELWVVDKNVGINNIWVGSNETAVHEWNKIHFIPKLKEQEANNQDNIASKSRPGSVDSETIMSLLINTLFGGFFEAYRNAVSLYPKTIYASIAFAVIATIVSFAISFVIDVYGEELYEKWKKKREQNKSRNDKKKKKKN